MNNPFYEQDMDIKEYINKRILEPWVEWIEEYSKNARVIGGEVKHYVISKFIH